MPCESRRPGESRGPSCRAHCIGHRAADGWVPAFAGTTMEGRGALAFGRRPDHCSRHRRTAHRKPSLFMPEAPRVALFVTCLVDLFRPTIGFAAVKLLEQAGCTVE